MFVFTWIGELIVTLIAANVALGIVEFVAYLLDSCTYSSPDDEVIITQHGAITLIAFMAFLIVSCVVIAGNAPDSAPVAIETIAGGTWV